MKRFISVVLNAIATLTATLVASVSVTPVHAQTQDGCPTIINLPGFNCQNPHNIQGGPPVPSYASPLGVVQDGSHTCRNNPSSP